MTGVAGDDNDASALAAALAEVHAAFYLVPMDACGEFARRDDGTTGSVGMRPL